MQIEIRANKESMSVRGYVNVTGRDSRILQDKSGPYIEQIAPGAFGTALAAGNPVELRFDHGKVLGSTETGEVELREDSIGLLAEATVTDPEVIQAAENRALQGWSFGFVKKADRWATDENGTRRRTVDALELREVSILDKTPAYTATSIETRSDGDLLVEFRMMEESEPEYTRTEETVTETTVIETEPDGREVETFLASKRLEIYRMKRR